MTFSNQFKEKQRKNKRTTKSDKIFPKITTQKPLIRKRSCNIVHIKSSK